MKSVRLLLIVYCLIIGAWAIAQTQVAIQWEWRNGRIMERYGDGIRLQFGLRDDGVVVWRELLSGTNSPAEQPAHRSRMAPQVVPQVGRSTNVLTNLNFHPPPLPQ